MSAEARGRTLLSFAICFIAFLEQRRSIHPGKTHTNTHTHTSKHIISTLFAQWLNDIFGNGNGAGQSAPSVNKAGGYVHATMKLGWIHRFNHINDTFCEDKYRSGVYNNSYFIQIILYKQGARLPKKDKENNNNNNNAICNGLWFQETWLVNKQTKKPTRGTRQMESLRERRKKNEFQAKYL